MQLDEFDIVFVVCLLIFGRNQFDGFGSGFITQKQPIYDLSTIFTICPYEFDKTFGCRKEIQHIQTKSMCVQGRFPCENFCNATLRILLCPNRMSNRQARQFPNEFNYLQHSKNNYSMFWLLQFDSVTIEMGQQWQ